MAGPTRRTRKTPLPEPESAPLSELGDISSPRDAADNGPEDDPTDIPAPTPVVTISAENLRAIQQKIADLQAAIQENPRRRRRSDSESDYERQPKRSNLRGKAPIEYWGEDHPRLDSFIRQCEENFDIDGCTLDRTRIAFAGSYCRGTPAAQWQEYKRRPENRFPHVITWDDMKKELRRQLGEDHVYIDQMYEKWQRATERISQTGKEFGAYLQLIRTNLQEFGEEDLLSEKLLIHHVRQGLRPKVRAALFLNPTVPKNWPTFLAAVARAKSFIQEHKSSSHPGKPSMHNKEKPVEKATENDPNSNGYSRYKNTNS